MPDVSVEDGSTLVRLTRCPPFLTLAHSESLQEPSRLRCRRMTSWCSCRWALLRYRSRRSSPGRRVWSACCTREMKHGHNQESVINVSDLVWAEVPIELTWGTWGPDGWFCGGGGSSCHLQCPLTSQPEGRGWFCGPPSAPRTVGLGHSIPSRYSNKEPECTRPWKETQHSIIQRYQSVIHAAKR